MARKKSIIFSNFLLASILPATTISCKGIDDLIKSKIDLNTYDVTVYDALEDIKSQNPLKIKNIDYFKEQGINISLISSEIDWDKQVVNSTLLYKTKEDLNEKSLRITNSFFDFKSPDNADWKRIFNSLNKLTQIEWLGNNKFNITNKYAKVTNQKIAPITLSGPRPEDFSYQLTAINSHKITGDILDTYSKDVIRGGF